MTDRKPENEPPFVANLVRPARGITGRVGARKAPYLIAAILDTATTSTAVFVPPLPTETLDQTRARVATVYQTIRRQGFGMRTTISHDPPGIYAWAVRTEDETK